MMLMMWGQYSKCGVFFHGMGNFYPFCIAEVRAKGGERDLSSLM